jgi:hypothetical protein
LTSEEYKQRFGYNLRRALMIGPVRRTHSSNTTRFGLADPIRRRPLLESLELRRRGGRHPHALEEAPTRRERRAASALIALARDRHGRFARAQTDQSICER